LFDELKEEYGEDLLADLSQEDLYGLVEGERQGYNAYIFEQNKTFKEICRNDKSFEIDFESYLNGFDGETKDLLGVDPGEGDKFLDIKGVIAQLKRKKVLFEYAKEWSSIDLKPYNNSEITTLEEHIKRKWADISAETAGEQFTPDDVIALIAEIIASKVVEDETLLKIYDCTCGGGNLLFGVEDRINKKLPNRYTQTFGQDWNDALYALARIESRFRSDSRIAYGNTLTNDAFYNDEFDIVIANPPYGVSWKGYQTDIRNDKTGRFKFLPSISDGQLLFMQHLIAKLSMTGIGVVVHNGSTLFSGDAGSAESNIRKWMLDSDIVEAIIQLPTDEFFNTGIYTYLWVLNKEKPTDRRDKVMLINASQKFKPLKKSRGSKRKEIDEASRLEIVETLRRYEDNEYARLFDKEFFYFNKQAIQLTNVDADGNSFEALLDGKKSLKLKPLKLSNGEQTIIDFEIIAFDKAHYDNLKAYYTVGVKPLLAALDYKEQPLRVETEEAVYYYDSARDSLIKAVDGEQEALGCGKIVIKAGYKRKTKTKPERIEITVELTADYQKDYEIIPYQRDEAANQQAIAGFMDKYISKPFIYLDNVVGVEINFNKVFYKPEKLRSVTDVLAEISQLDEDLKALEDDLIL
jgi:type I restriction enzyme M protein